MSDDKLLSIIECCELLKVSRPTFEKMRKKHSLKEYLVGSRPRFSRNEITKILYSEISTDDRDARVKKKEAKENIKALIVNDFDLDKAYGGMNIDIDKLSVADSYGVSSLLCKLIGESGRLQRKIYTSKGFMRAYFQKLNFLPQLQKFSGGSVQIDASMLIQDSTIFPEIILPISQVGFKTAEKKYLEQIRAILRTQGFSNEIGDYIGWTLGELADNSHTHSDCGGKVFISIERLEAKEHNYLQINILDMGDGIHTTLKKNVKYSNLSDEKALLMAFKSKVSSWGDEHQRGKGLTDILKIAFECNSFFRVESCNLAYMFYCQDKRREVKKIMPATSTNGTRFSIVLIDNDFKEIKRTEVDRFVDEFLEQL